MTVIDVLRKLDAGKGLRGDGADARGADDRRGDDHTIPPQRAVEKRSQRSRHYRLLQYVPAVAVAYS